jgi:hypothetical protein
MENVFTGTIIGYHYFEADRGFPSLALLRQYMTRHQRGGRWLNMAEKREINDYYNGLPGLFNTITGKIKTCGEH